MSYRVQVLADSISRPLGIRLTTCAATYPRIVHSEEMTHREKSRNSASTRAIPLKVQLRNLLQNPFIPERFGINQPGMQAYQHLAGLKYDQAVEIWLAGRDRAVTTTLELILGRETAADLLNYDPTREYVSGEVLLRRFTEIEALLPMSGDFDPSETTLLNVHKQLAGRGLEAYMWHTIIVTATEWGNYFGLRDHPDAQGEIAHIARMIRQAYEASEPRPVDEGEWHLPLVDEGEFDDVFDAVRSSAARCAAVSYNRQDAKNPEKEFQRYEDLRRGGHMSPLEHQATPFTRKEILTRERMARVGRMSGRAEGLDELTIEQLVRATQFKGNFRGWTQHRKQVAFEHNFSLLPTA